MQEFPLHIICNTRCKYPSYLCTYLDKENVKYKKNYAIDNTLSDINLDETAGLIFMGSPHSVNDEHDWIAEEIVLTQRAVSQNVPVMGICFGAQMVSMALGGIVTMAPCMELGWHQITVEHPLLPDNRKLLLPDSFEAFEWHEDTFSNPENTIPLFHGQHIKNQGFLLGKTLAIQFHLEMTESMITDWLNRYKDCLPLCSPSVQSPEQVRERLDVRLKQLNTVADQIYGWWLSLAGIK